MNKKRLIFAFVIMGIGIIGVIPSVFFAAPYVANTAQEVAKASQKLSEEKTVATIEEKVTDINVTSKDISIFVKKSNTDKVQLKTVNSTTRDVGVKYEIKDNKLNVVVEDNRKAVQTKKVSTFKELVELGLHELATEYAQPQAIIEVPEKVNIITTTGYSDLYIEDSAIVKENVTLRTENGDVSFGNINHKDRLNELTIESKYDTQLHTEALQLFKKIDVRANRVDVYPSYMATYNAELYTEELNIKTSGGNITFDTPFFKKLNVEAVSSGNYLDINLPLKQWNPMLHVKGNVPNVEIDTEMNNDTFQKFDGYPYPTEPKGQMEMNVVSNGVHVEIGEE